MSSIVSELLKRIQQHDVTYEWSDDFSAYKRGSSQLREIHEIAKLLSSDKILPILWDHVMSRRFPGKAELLYLQKKGL